MTITSAGHPRCGDYVPVIRIGQMHGLGKRFPVRLGRGWFTENPRSGLTIRQVPVLGMGTNWLARNRRLVLVCLNVTEQPHDSDPDEELEQHDLDPLGLKALPVHVDVILADPALSAEHSTYLRLEQERLPSPFILSRRRRP